MKFDPDLLNEAVEVECYFCNSTIKVRHERVDNGPFACEDCEQARRGGRR